MDEPPCGPVASTSKAVGKESLWMWREGLTRQIEKLVPQPHEAVAFGFWMTNRAPTTYGVVKSTPLNHNDMGA